MFMRYLNLAILASTAFSQYAPAKIPNRNDMARELVGDFPVLAYICLDDNSKVSSPTTLTQGSFLQVCVKVDNAVGSDTILVENILTFVVSQPDGIATDSETITNTVADALTKKVCRESGICNVKTQLLSKFFTETNPGDLRVDGVAILAFGKASLMPSSTPTAAPIGRRLRVVPIRGLITGDDVKAFMTAQQRNIDDDNDNDGDGDNDRKSWVSLASLVTGSSQRMLQEGANQSGFGLEVGLNGDSGDQSSSSGGVSTMIVAVIVLHLLAAGCGLVFFCCIRKRLKEEPKDIVDHDICNASIGTYPNQASVNSSSSSQYASYLASRRTTTISTETSCVFPWFHYQKKPRGGDKGIVDHHRSNASDSTGPGQASVFSSSSSQQVSHHHHQRDCEQID
jgi:hypothetical protein